MYSIIINREKQQEKQEKTQVNNAITTMNQFNYNPELNGKKILLLVATHTDTDLKKESIKAILKYFQYKCIDIVIANSTNLEMREMKEYYATNNVKYYEIENDPTYDFGKWVYLLSTVKYDLYDDIIFINDSILLKNKVNHFINLAITNNFDLYGYNDSSEINYHYQSYLFSIKPRCVYKFIDMVISKKHMIQTWLDVVFEVEVKMLEHFTNHSCFLKIGNLSTNKNKNIHVHNDTLFDDLYKRDILPFIKIKKIVLDI